MTAPKRRSLRNTVARALLAGPDWLWEWEDLRTVFAVAAIAAETVAEWLDNQGDDIVRPSRERRECCCDSDIPCAWHEATLDGVDLAAMAIVRGWAS